MDSARPECSPIPARLDAELLKGRDGCAKPPVGDAPFEFAADGVLVYAHSRGTSSWLERDVVVQLRERHRVPVEQIVVEPDH